MVTHDAHIVSSGITPVFDALSVGDVIRGSTRVTHLQTLLEALDSARRRGYCGPNTCCTCAVR